MTAPSTPLQESVEHVEQRAIRELEREIRKERVQLRNRRLLWALKLPFAVVIGLIAFGAVGFGGLQIAAVILGTAAVADAAIHSRRELANRVAKFTAPGAIGALASAGHEPHPPPG
jgi:hypothetical protein